MRCFIGAFLSSDEAVRVWEMTPSMWGFRPVPSENLHVTLRFLGDQTDEQVRDTLTWLATLELKAMDCAVVAVTGLPRPRRARVLALELDAAPVMEALHDQLVQRFGPEERPFRPHITLGRSKRPRMVKAHQLPTGCRIALRSPRLYRSETLPSGARYTEVRSADVPGACRQKPLQ